MPELLLKFIFPFEKDKKCYSSCNEVELLSYRNGYLIKFNVIQNANSGGWLEEEKGGRTRKQKADPKSDTEGRRRKNMNKKGERRHSYSKPTILQ